MRGCIRCHGPTDHNHRCYICDRGEFEAAPPPMTTPSEADREKAREILRKLWTSNNEKPPPSIHNVETIAQALAERTEACAALVGTYDPLLADAIRSRFQDKRP